MPFDLLRQAVLRTLSERERAILHSKVLHALERLEGEGASIDALERLAHHADLAMDPRRAADYHARCAELARSEERCDVAAHHFVRAAQLHADHTPDEVGRWLDEALVGLELAPEASAAQSAAWALVESGYARTSNGEVRVRAALLLARKSMSRRDYSSALRRLAEVDKELSAVHPGLAAETRLQVGWALCEQGRPHEAAEQLTRALDSAYGPERGKILCALAEVLSQVGRLDEADRTVSEALAAGARFGEAAIRFAALCALAALEEAKDHVALAAERYDEALDIADSSFRPESVARAAARGAVCALAAHNDELGERLAGRARALEGDASVEVWSWVAAATLEAFQIRAKRTLDLSTLQQRVENLRERDAPAPCSLSLEALVCACVALGDAGAAEKALAEAIARAEEAGWVSRAQRLQRRELGA